MLTLKKKMEIHYELDYILAEQQSLIRKQEILKMIDKKESHYKIERDKFKQVKAKVASLLKELKLEVEIDYKLYDQKLKMYSDKIEHCKKEFIIPNFEIDYFDVEELINKFYIEIAKKYGKNWVNDGDQEDFKLNRQFLWIAKENKDVIDYYEKIKRKPEIYFKIKLEKLIKQIMSGYGSFKYRFAYKLFE